MIDLKLTAAHDIEITNGDAVLADESVQVAQHCKIRLLFWQGEWILDYTKGVAYLGGIYSRSVSQELKDQILKDAIVNTPGVKSLIDYAFGMDYAAHTALVTFEASTIYGDVIVEVRT